jgi:hypothetical protein
VPARTRLRGASARQAPALPVQGVGCRRGRRRSRQTGILLNLFDITICVVIITTSCRIHRYAIGMAAGSGYEHALAVLSLKTRLKSLCGEC